jgi:hypothetical protein
MRADLNSLSPRAPYIVLLDAQTKPYLLEDAHRDFCEISSLIFTPLLVTEKKPQTTSGAFHQRC